MRGAGIGAGVVERRSALDARPGEQHLHAVVAGQDIDGFVERVRCEIRLQAKMHCGEAGGDKLETSDVEATTITIEGCEKWDSTKAGLSKDLSLGNPTTKHLPWRSVARRGANSISVAK